jgi:hypothetical protein
MAASVCSIGCSRPAIPLPGRDDADGDGVPEPERVANGDDPVPLLHLRGVAEAGFLQRLGRHVGELDERAVGQRVVADDLCRVFLVATGADERDLDVHGPFDDVVVGENVAGPVDDEPRPGALRELIRRLPAPVPLAGRTPRRLLTEEAAQQIVAAAAAPTAEELGEVLRALARLRPDVHDGGGLRLGDVAERGGVDRTAERRAVHRRHGHHLCLR